MLQIARRYPEYNLLSFEDPRLSTFQVQDFFKREVKGLTEALHELGLKEGFILTYDQKDEIKEDGKTVILLPVWEWLTE